MSIPPAAFPANDLFTHVDAALYRAKRDGRNRIARAG